MVSGVAYGDGAESPPYLCLLFLAFGSGRQVRKKVLPLSGFISFAISPLAFGSAG